MCDLSKSAIVSHAFPGPSERCSICHQLVPRPPTELLINGGNFVRHYVPDFKRNPSPYTHWQDFSLSFFAEYKNVTINGGTFVKHYHHHPSQPEADFIITQVPDQLISDCISGFFADHQRVTIMDGNFEILRTSDMDSTEITPPTVTRTQFSVSGAQNILINGGNFHISGKEFRRLEDPSIRGFFSEFFANNENLLITDGIFECSPASIIVRAATESERNPSNFGVASSDTNHARNKKKRKLEKAYQRLRRLINKN